MLSAGAVTGAVTSLAIAWLVMAVNLRDLKRAGGPMLGAFTLAVAGTGAGVLTGTALFGAGLGDQKTGLAGCNSRFSFARPTMLYIRSTLWPV